MDYLLRDVAFFEDLTLEWCDLCRGGWHAVTHPDRQMQCGVEGCGCIVTPTPVAAVIG